jgi:hypothetical protein
VEAVEVGPFDTIMDATVDADGNPMGHNRVPGLHLGAIIKRIRALRGGTGAPPGWQDGSAMYFGFLWEWALELAFRVLGLLRPNSVKQLRLEYNGIHGTLDGVDFEDDENVVLEEYKATWRTQKNVWIDKDLPEAQQRVDLARQLETNFPDWMIQMKGYLKMLGAYLETPVTSARRPSSRKGVGVVIESRLNPSFRRPCSRCVERNAAHHSSRQDAHRNHCLLLRNVGNPLRLSQQHFIFFIPAKHLIPHTFLPSHLAGSASLYGSARYAVCGGCRPASLQRPRCRASSSSPARPDPAPVEPFGRCRE